MAAGSVTYDSVINVQTLSWVIYDVFNSFELAPHIDLDVHISLLYGTEDKPSNYTGIRTAYPVDRSQRIGLLTPPDPSDNREYEEKTMGGEYLQSSHKYVGNLNQSPSDSELGVRQTLQLKNKTAITELSLIDTPLAGTVSKTFNDNAWFDFVPNIIQNFSSTLFVQDGDAHMSMTKASDAILLSTGDMGIDVATRRVYGVCYIKYDPDFIYLTDVDVLFPGVLDTVTYDIKGFTDPTLSTGDLTIEFEDYVQPGSNIFEIFRQVGCVVILKVFLNSSSIVRDRVPESIRIDFGAGEWGYMVDRVKPHNPLYNISSISMLSELCMKDSISVSQEIIRDSVYVQPRHLAYIVSFSSRSHLQTTGYVDGGYFDDNIQLAPNPSYYTKSISLNSKNMPLKTPIASSSIINDTVEHKTMTLLYSNSSTTISSAPILSSW